MPAMATCPQGTLEDMLMMQDWIEQRILVAKPDCPEISSLLLFGRHRWYCQMEGWANEAN